MKIKTKFMDEIEIEESNDIFFFPQGLSGFEGEKKFVIIEPEEKCMFKWLQSIENPNLAFVITNPFLFWPDYVLNPHENDLKAIAVEAMKEISIFVILTVSEDRLEDITANLLGPVIINTENNQAKQVVLDNPHYTTKHRLIDTLEIKNNVSAK